MDSLVSSITGPDVKSFEWRVAGVSVAGTSHVRSGLVCQDNRAWFDAGDIVGMAIADGAGSKPFSEHGSAVAVRAAIVHLVEQYERGSLKNSDEKAGGWLSRWFCFKPKKQDDDDGLRMRLKQSFAAAAKAVEVEAAELGTTPQELATTLIVTLAGPDFVAAAQVGDGAVVVEDENSNLFALTAPTTGEFVNETVFLTSPSAPLRLQANVRRLRPVNLAMFSDGLQMLALKMPSGEPHAPFFSPLFRYITTTSELEAERGLKDFLKSNRVGSRTDDDLTLILAHLAEA